MDFRVLRTFRLVIVGFELVATNAGCVNNYMC